MFDFDSIREITATISKNKLRTALTCLAVAWGIIMLIVLIGVGNGLSNAAKENFSDRSNNKVYLWPRSTTKAYKGLASDRKLKFTEQDYIFMKKTFPEIEYISPIVNETKTVSYENEYGSWGVNGVSEYGNIIYNIKISEGRFINKTDVDKRRKTIVLNTDAARILFKDANPLGKHVLIGSIAFTVVGIYNSENQFYSDNPAYIPISTAKMMYRQGYSYDEIVFTVKGINTIEENKAFIERLMEKIAFFKHYDPTDKGAIGIWNSAAQAVQANNIFNIISIFIRIIGAASLVTGIIGVGNIMLITVKERTREIGIRKAIGARPRSILGMIISESVFITAVAGYCGMGVGIVFLEIVNKILSMGGDRIPLKDLSVDLRTVFIATLILIICGVLAGLIPAIKAAKVSPIESMRAE